MTDRDIEREAHIFAVCLLMPRQLILEDLKQPIDLGSDEWIKYMCKKYQVSTTALVFRLSLLKHKF